MKLLLHICCAPCGAYLIKELQKKFQVIIFFYNPNIWPKEEYEKRLNEVKKFCQKEKIKLIEGEDENDFWFEKIKGFEKEPEGGERCKICFQMRLKKTAEKALELGIKNFSTSLAISPYKDLKTIKKIGDNLAQKFSLNFVIFQEDKKKDFWQKSREFSKKENFYHQNYCGCLYSLNLFKYLKNNYNRNIMNDTKWENLIFMLEEKFGILNRNKEKIEVAKTSQGESIFGEKETLEFSGPQGKMKIERIGRPKIVDKKILSTKRIGGKVAVDYIYSDEEKTYEVKIYKLDENGEWQEINLESLT